VAGEDKNFPHRAVAIRQFPALNQAHRPLGRFFTSLYCLKINKLYYNNNGSPYVIFLCFKGNKPTLKRLENSELSPALLEKK
jgi:hypothetical protein